MVATGDSWKHEPFTTGTPITYAARFSAEEFARIRNGLVPEEMEDKWFVFWREPFLHLHRSWTGDAVYRVTLAAASDGATVAEALAADAGEPEDPRYDAAVLDFLIANLLLGQSKPFPVPDDVAEPAEGVFQHVVAGTSYPEVPFRHARRRRWFEFWR